MNNTENKGEDNLKNFRQQETNLITQIPSLQNKENGNFTKK